MSSRKIEDLHPELQLLAIEMLDNLKKQGLDVIITCTYRSWVEQDYLYAQGRTKGGNIVTWARGGESLHNNTLNGKPASLAFDVVPIIKGKAYWSTDKEGVKIWQIVGLAGKNLGLEWGGDWGGFKREFPHFQLNKGVRKHVVKNKAKT